MALEKLQELQRIRDWKQQFHDCLQQVAMPIVRVAISKGVLFKPDRPVLFRCSCIVDKFLELRLN
jgi:hypothetical protein